MQVLSTILLTVIYFLPTKAISLPIGFGRTQGDQIYHEKKSKYFYVYHDSRTPHEASGMLNALDTAKPILEEWLQVQRNKPMPVIMSATTGNPSFANFITDAIELQTYGEGTRDLAWHEYVHSTMYRHFLNWFGPAGSILHLPWMPAWWIEGLAEALTASTGSDIQAGIERYHALSNQWPSYERLHSLYAKYDFSLRGYATSGAFVNYILRTYAPQNLPKILEEFYWSSMPWLWPVALAPFNDFMPLDYALKKITKKTGRQLYEEYKAEAKEFWTKADMGELLSNRKGQRSSFSGISSLVARGNDIFIAAKEDGYLHYTQVSFSNNIWAYKWKTVHRYPKDIVSSPRIFNKKLKVAVKANELLGDKVNYEIMVHTEKKDQYKGLVTRTGYISQMFETPQKLVWLEEELEENRLCYTLKSYAYKKKTIPSPLIKCPLTVKQPQTLKFLGEKIRQSSEGQFVTEKIWLTLTEQTMVGDRHFIITLDPVSDDITKIRLSQRGQPVSLAYAGNQIWLLVAESNKRSLRRINDKGECLGILQFSDTPLKVVGLTNGALVLSLLEGNDRPLVKINPADFKEQRCYYADDHTSPLLYAVQNPDQSKIHLSIQGAMLWRTKSNKDPKTIEQRKDERPPLDRDFNPDTVKDQSSKPAKWRGRPVLAFPWLGADAQGSNFGVLSVPLMDHLQNETIRLTALYGLESRFPTTEISFLTTRFWPDYRVDAFRSQTWNGIVRKSSGESQSAYMDERGVRFSSGMNLTPINTEFIYGIKASTLIPYIGPTTMRGGQLNEPFIDLSAAKTFGKFRWSNLLHGAMAPKAINETFDYNKLAIGSTLSRSLEFLDSSLSLGIEGSRTRGQKRRELQEFYRPLKTFVPGSGSGINDLNFPIISSGGLFSASFGDTQARTKLNWTMPLIEDFDKVVSLFYIERLDLSAFINYGGAWDGPAPEPDDLIAAHGYNLDLQFDNKGVRFTFGGGVGQVIGEPFELYLTFSFDMFL